MAARRSPPSPRRSGPRVVGAPEPSSQYEFNAVENGIIQSTASAATKWGWLMLVGGVVGLGFGIWGLIQSFSLGGLLGLIGPLFAFFIGSMFRSAGQYFYDVVNTRGNDVKLMMRALERLGIVLFAQFFLVILGVALSFGVSMLLRFL